MDFEDYVYGSTEFLDILDVVSRIEKEQLKTELVGFKNFRKLKPEDINDELIKEYGFESKIVEYYQNFLLCVLRENTKIYNYGKLIRKHERQ